MAQNHQAILRMAVLEAQQPIELEAAGTPLRLAEAPVCREEIPAPDGD
jgi:hypothetical protein